MRKGERLAVPEAVKPPQKMRRGQGAHSPASEQRVLREKKNPFKNSVVRLGLKLQTTHDSINGVSSLQHHIWGLGTRGARIIFDGAPVTPLFGVPAQTGTYSSGGK